MKTVFIKFGKKLYAVKTPRAELSKHHLLILQKIYEAGDKGITISKAMITERKYSWQHRIDIDIIVNDNPHLFQSGKYGPREGKGWKFAPTPLQKILAKDTE